MDNLGEVILVANGLGGMPWNLEAAVLVGCWC
jgi:hypothetical protein